MINQNGVTSSMQISTSGVSWGAILAGAAAIAALSLILLILGTGLGLSSVSPWANSGIAATTFGVSTILWITFTSLIASGMGGYIAGRLRTKWIDIHTDEVYFRDTAHGFLAWSIASLTTAVLLTSVIGSIISGGVQAGASLAGGAAATATAAAGGAVMTTGSHSMKAGGSHNPIAYFVDSLFRKNVSSTSSTSTPATKNDNAYPAEVTPIFMNAIHSGTLPKEDVQYVGQLVAQRTGMTQQAAEQRVNDVYGQMQKMLEDAKTAAKTTADKSRKASAYAALWIFVSLLGGAFVASWAATYGGRRRDA